MKEEKLKERILIVDDAPTNIKILREALKSKTRLTFATNGADALKIARSDPPPDMILLGVVMSDMNGYEVCTQLKANKETEHIPIIFITTKLNEEDEIKGLETGAVDYITKPFSSAIVKARVQTHLELKRLRDILKNLSSIDGLTGIPNRRRFDDYLAILWKQAIREVKTLSLIMIDIDHFKAFNDKYGHQAGDDCLKKVAKTLKDTVGRPLDFVARYGGEEFVCVLPKTDFMGAVALAERLRNRVEALKIPHELSPSSDWITISLGTATILPTRGSSPTVLIEAADNELLKVKKGDRNQVLAVNLNDHP